MKTRLKYKEIENIVKNNNIIKKCNIIVDGNGNEIDSVFTSSDEADIIEMIESGLSVDEIIEIIKQW